MTRNEARQQVQDMLGHRGDLVEKIEAAFRFVQNELETEATLPWFLKKVDDTFTTAIGENLIQKPEDFIRFADHDPMSQIINGVNFPIVKGDLKKLREKYTGFTRSMGFAEFPDEFQLVPAATAEYPLILTYYANDDKLQTNIENRWLAHLPGLMIGRAGFIIATGIRDQAAQQLFGALAAAGTEKLAQMSTAQEEAGGRLIIGGED